MASCRDAITEWNSKGRAQFNMLSGVDIQVEGSQDEALSLTVGDGEIVEEVDARVAKVATPQLPKT